MITLEQANLTGVLKLYTKAVIDTFKSNSFILNNAYFTANVSPVGGDTLMYGYNRIKSPRTAGVRKWNNEFTPETAEIERVTVDLKPLGGSFNIDRGFIESGDGALNTVAIQMNQLIKATTQAITDLYINGDISTNADEFDGINAVVTGESTDVTAGVDISTQTALEANWKTLMNSMDEAISEMIEKPTAIFMNSKLKVKFMAMAREYGSYSNTMDEFGKTIDMYNGIPFIDLGDKSGSTDPIIEVDGTTGETALYMATLSPEWFHFASKRAESPIMIRDVKNDEAGVMKSGDVEMIVAPVFKTTKAVAKVGGIKVQ